jgi:hypothetical protein
MGALAAAVPSGFVAMSVALWLWSQRKISEQKPPAPAATGIGDRLHNLSAPWHAWLVAHPKGADALLIGTSAGIDVFGIYLLGAAVFGPTTQPFLAVLVVFALRQLCQWFVSLPEPPDVIWRYPGWPSLLVTYHVENDFFFSGHTAVSAVAMLELIHFAPAWLAALAVVLTVIEAGTVIVLRAHYTMDVVTALFAAGIAAVAAGWMAPGVDALLHGLA